MADNRAVEVTRFIRSLGVHGRSDPTSVYATAGSIGRPDYQCTYIRNDDSYASFWIEVKSGHDSFQFESENPTKGWTKQQQEWVTTFGAENHVWYALLIGDGSPIRKTKPRQCFLIPYYKWRECYELLMPIQKTLPHYLSKNHRVALRDLNLSAESFFKSYALLWVGNSTYGKKGYGPWVLPETHEFYQRIIAPDPLPQNVGKGRYFDVIRNKKGASNNAV